MKKNTKKFKFDQWIVIILSNSYSIEIINTITNHSNYELIVSNYDNLPIINGNLIKTTINKKKYPKSFLKKLNRILINEIRNDNLNLNVSVKNY